MAIKRTLLFGLLLAVSAAQAQSGAVRAPNVLGEVYSGAAVPQGSLLLAAGGTPLLSGSQVSAGDGAALVKLKRGGTVRVCPKTNLALSADSSGRSMVLGLNVGSMELQYSLSGGADLLMTPDLQLQLISPGTFHLAISLGPMGDTCIRSLPGSNAAVFVSEMMGNGHYQIGPGKSVMFGRGRISDATPAPSVCGCPQLSRQLASEQSGSAATWSESQAASTTQAPAKAAEEPVQATSSAPETESAASKPAAQSGSAAASGVAHLESNTAFVFRGDDEGQDLYTSVSSLKLSTDNSQLAMALLPKVVGPEEGSAPPAAPPAVAQPQALAAPAEAPQPKREGKHRGFFHSIGHFFGRLFH